MQAGNHFLPLDFYNKKEKEKEEEAGNHYSSIVTSDSVTNTVIFFIFIKQVHGTHHIRSEFFKNKIKNKACMYTRERRKRGREIPL